MSPFEHLAVLISIVLGLSLAHLLSAVQRVVVARERIRFYWLPLTWVGLLFVTQVVWWWGIFELRSMPTWNFFYFLFVLLSPVTLYLASASVLPEVREGRGYDLREHYYANRGLLFGMVAAGPVLDGLRRGVQAGSWVDLGALSNLVSALLVGWLAVTRRPMHHAVVTGIVSAIFVYFIVSQAIQLR